MADNVIILAGGQGKRMKVNMPKVLCNVLGEPMLEWVITSCEEAGLDKICVVTGYESKQVENYLENRNGTAEISTVLQKEPLGTGHAVMQAEKFLADNKDGNTLILCGDAPFIDPKTIKDALALHTSKNSSVTVVTSTVDQPKGYGRIIRTDDGISGIVEEKDCTDEQRNINEINSGCYWYNTSDLIEVLSEITNDNAQGEYYLTDCVELLLRKGRRADAFTSENPDVALGANDRRALLKLNDIARYSIIEKWLDEGIEFLGTDGVSIGRKVTIGKGTKIGTNVVLKGNSSIGENCNIGTGCIIENTTIGNNADLNYVQAYDSTVDDDVKIGPFVQLRPNSHIKSKVKIGDFVEVKNSTVGEGTAIAHLTYVGDSDVGSHVNFGCGVVTVNFDAEKKSRTVIGNNSFIGCNTNLIAPVKIGNSSYTAAGSTIDVDIPDGALGVSRHKGVTIIEGYAEKKLAKRNKKILESMDN